MKQVTYIYRKINKRNTKSSKKYRKYDQAAIRRLAIHFFTSENIHPELIAERICVSVRSVYRWIDWYKKRGMSAFQLPKPSRKCKLIDEQINEIITIVITKTPLNFGFETSLWTRTIICKIILDKFSISIHESTIGKIFKRKKITYQKPIRKYYQQNKSDVDYFCHVSFQKLKQKAEKENAIIVFLDECTAKVNPNNGKTWGEIGKTPIIPADGSRYRINVIGTLDLSGNSHFMTFENNIDSITFIVYLDEFMKNKKNKVYMILDNAGFHNSKLVKSHVEKKYKEKLELINLPSYSPELNPVELLWAHLKSHGINRIVTKNKNDFFAAVEIHLSEFMKNKNLCRNFFNKNELSYIFENEDQIMKAA